MWGKRFLTGFFFTSCAAVAMVTQTFLLLHQPISLVFCALVFCLVFLGYNFYLLLYAAQGNPWDFSLWTKKNLRWRIFIIFLVLPIFVGTTTQVQFGIGSWFFLTMSFAIYFMLKFVKNQKYFFNNGWVKTVWISIIWTVVTFYFPVRFSGMMINFEIGMMMLQRYSFIFLIALFNDLRDVKKDLMLRRNTLATQLGENRWTLVTFFFVLISIGILGWIYIDGIFSGWEVCVSIFATVSVGLFIFSHKQIKNRLVFVILGDGMMILYTGLLFVERISLLC